MENKDKKYYAFISYDRRDSKVVRYVQDFLEHFHYPDDKVAPEFRPDHPKYLRRIFVDTTDLDVRPDHFEKDILKALQNSRYLIVICSPNSAQQKPENPKHYVNWEIEEFLATHNGDTRLVFPVLYDKTPNSEWNEYPNISEYLPPALDNDEFKNRNLPNFRPGIDELHKKRPNLKQNWENAACQTISGLLNVERKIVKDRHVEEKLRKLHQTIAIAVIVTLLLAIFTFWAIFERNIAITQKNKTGALLDFFLIDLRDDISSYVPVKTKVNILKKIKEYIDNTDNEGDVKRFILYLQQAGNSLREIGDISEVQNVYQESLKKMRELVKKDPNNNQWQSYLALSLQSVGDMYIYQNKSEESLNAYKESWEITRYLLEKNPKDVPLQKNFLEVLKLINLVNSQIQNGSTIDKKIWQDSLELVRNWAKNISQNEREQSNLADYLYTIGMLYTNLDNKTEAQKAYQESLKLTRQLIEKNPNNDELQLNLVDILFQLGSIYFSQGDIKEALNIYQESVKIMEPLAEADPKNHILQQKLAESNYHIGMIYIFQGNIDQALNEFNENLKKIRILIEKDSLSEKNLQNNEWQRLMADSLEIIGQLYFNKGDVTEALNAFQECLVIRRLRAKEDAENMFVQLNLAGTLQSAESIYTYLGDTTGAQKAFQEDLDIIRSLVEKDPENTLLSNHLCQTLMLGGTIYEKQGNITDAQKAYQESLDIMRTLAENPSQDDSPKIQLANNFCCLGTIYYIQENIAEAQKVYQKSLDIMRPLVEKAPQEASRQFNLTLSLYYLGCISFKQDNIAEAQNFYQESLERMISLVKDCSDQDWYLQLAIYFYRIGDTYAIQGNIEKAQKMYQESLIIMGRLSIQNPLNVQYQLHFAISLYKKRTPETLSKAFQILQKIKRDNKLPVYCDELIFEGMTSDELISAIEEELKKEGITPEEIESEEIQSEKKETEEIPFF